MKTVNAPTHIPVAVFMTRFQPGGTERQMTELVRRLEPGRFRVHVACFHQEGAWLSRVAERAASVVEFPIRGFARPSTLRQLLQFARWCRRERVAVVQTCDLYANIFGLCGAALARVPVRIASRRELNPDKSAGQIRLQHLAYRWATTIVANSPAAERMLREEGIDPASIAVIPNGLDASAFAEAPRERPLRTIISVANLRREKHHETLIAAAARLITHFPALRLQFVGAGPRRAELEASVAAEGLSERAEFLGHREDVPALLSQADIFVLPSVSEAFPNAVIEAMAAGLPVVASAVGGILDLVDHGRTGILVPPCDAGALAAALRHLLSNPSAARAIGREARREALQRFSFERMVEAFERLYEESLRSSLSAAARRAQVAEA